jgi:NADPH:quinone reductase-like Zn-dependent oxidoreductase/malonyl CoA-acyl carrier protein transacylase
MLAVNLSAFDAQTYLESVPLRSVVVACVNSPTSVTLSGDADRIDQLAKQLQADGLFARKLRVETAYHSPHMDMVAEDYRKALQAIQPSKCRESTIAMFSSVTKERVYATDMTADYWVRNLVSPVEFLSAVTSLATMTEASQSRRRAPAVKWSAFLEIGPHEALKGPSIQVLKSLNDSLATVPYQALVRRHMDALQTTLNVAGLLWCIGIPIDIEAVNASINTAMPRLMSNLPSYPWNHQTSFWHEPVASARLRKRREPHHDLLGAPMDYQNEMEPRWRNFLRVSDIPWLADHVVADSILFPAAGMVVMVAEAARTLASPSQRLEGIEFNDFVFQQGLVIPDDDRGIETVLHVVPCYEVPGWYEFTIFSRPEDVPWVRHATGTFTLHYDDQGLPLNVEDWGHSVERFRKSQTAACETNCDAVYEWLSQTGGVAMGPAFRSITRAVFCAQENRLWTVSEVTDTQAMMPCEYESPCFIHPTSLDALFQAAVLSCSDVLGNQNAKIPVGVDRLYLSTNWNLQHGDTFFVHTETCSHDGDLRLDSIASDTSWSQPRVLLQGVRLGPVPMSKIPSVSTAVGGKSGTSRISSIIWAEHLESSASLAPAGQERYGQLTDWVQNICYTHGDACALVVTQPNWESPVITSIQPVTPQLGLRPCLQRLTIVVVGLDKEAEDFATTVSRLMPGTQVKQIAALRDLSPAAFSEPFFDVVLVDQPCLRKAADAGVLLASLSLTTKPDGVLAIRAHDDQLDPMDYIQRSSDWEASGLIQDGDIVLARRQRIPAPLDSAIFVLMPDAGHIPPTFKTTLERTFSTVGVQLRPIGVQDINGLAGKMVISMLEFRHPWISEWTSATMSQFKMLLEARYILWVSPIPSLSTNASAASFGASTGLLRTLRNERPSVALPQVQYDLIDVNNELSLAQGILQVIQLTLAPLASRYHDLEYRLQNGRLLVPRVVSEDLVDDRMLTLLHGPQPVLARLGDDLRALRFQTGSPDGHGGQWVEDRKLMSDLPDDHVEVQLSTRSIVAPGSRNANAHEVRLSVVEAVGVVTNLGCAGRTDLAVGDIVLLLVPGAGTMSGMSNRMQVSSKAVAKLPAQLALAQAVTIPLAYTLAYTSLFEIARLGPNCTVLLVGPMGHTLKALLNCALEVPGMHVYVATEGRAVAEELAARYAIAPERALSIHGGLDTRIASLTEGKGVTAVLSCLGGSTGRLAARCLRSGGHYVDLTGEMNLAALPKAVISQGCTFTSVNLNSMLQKQGEKVYSSFRHAVATIGPHHQLHPTTIFPLAKWADAEALARQTGMPVAIDLTDPSQVPVVPALQEPVIWSPQETFLLAGGLGMIGLGFAQTLVDSGVRHLVILSRSGVLQDSQRMTLASLADQGCHVDIVRCDISQEADIQRVLSQIHSQKLQLKGIIQCATVLKVSNFSVAATFFHTLFGWPCELMLIRMLCFTQ